METSLGRNQAAKGGLMGLADTFIWVSNLEARKELWFLDKCPLSRSLHYWSQLLVASVLGQVCGRV